MSDLAHATSDDTAIEAAQPLIGDKLRARCRELARQVVDQPLDLELREQFDNALTTLAKHSYYGIQAQLGLVRRRYSPEGDA